MTLYLQAGFILAIWGVVRDRLSNSSSTLMSSSASWAMAVRCMTALVEPLMARHALMALRMEPLVMICREVMFFSTSSMIFTPVSWAFIRRAAEVAGAVPPSGSVMPRASARQHMVLAVPR